MDIFDTSSSSDYENNDTSYGIDYDELVLRGREAGWPTPISLRIKGRCDCCGQKIPIKLKKYYKIEEGVTIIIAQARHMRLNRKLNLRRNWE